MRKENQSEFEFLNIEEWHEAGYTGKGIKIAVFEDADKEHGEMVIGVIKQIAPDVTLITQNEYLGSSKNDSERFRNFVDHCIEQGVHIITCSYSYSYNDTRFKYVNKAISHGIKWFNSAGNHYGEISEKFLHKHCPKMIVVGAVYHNANSIKPKRMSYSNYGSEIDHVMFTNIYTENGTKGTGTSTSTPADASLCALTTQLADGDTDLGLKILEMNIMDLGDDGKDMYFGAGLPILPTVVQARQVLEVLGMAEPKQIRDLNELDESTRILHDELKLKCREAGIEFITIETYRTQERQDYLYAQGRKEPYKNNDKVTWTTNSEHTKRRAFDVCPINDKNQCLWTRYDLFDKIGEIGKSIGLTWGGDWKYKDRPHFQYDGEPLKPNKEWQAVTLEKLVDKGKINSPQYWLDRWEEEIKVKDVIGLVGELILRNEKE